MHKAKKEGSEFVALWGTGKARREFLYIKDCAKALVHLMNFYEGDDIVNVGTGRDCTIKELAEAVKKTVGYKGEVLFDESKPDGTPQKVLDVSRINQMGWKAGTSLQDGIQKTYGWFLGNDRI